MSAPAQPAAVAGKGVGARAADLLSRAGLDFAYIGIGFFTSILAFCVWVTAVCATLSLLVFIIGLPVFLLSAIAFRWTAELDRRNAALALGRPLRGRYRDHGGEGFLTRLQNTATDRQTWKDLAWLVLHSGIGFGFGLIAIILVAQTIATVTLPAWYWAIDGGVDFGVTHVDSLGKALPMMLLAIPLAAITLLLLRGMTIAEAWLSAALLDSGAAGEGGEGAAWPAAAPAPAASAAAPEGFGAAAPGGFGAAAPQSAPTPGEKARRRLPDGDGAMIATASFCGFLALIVTTIWAATGASANFWPAWVYLGLLIPLSLQFGLREALRLVPERRALAVQAVVSAVLIGISVAVWALAGFGTFWPIWTILGVVTLFALHFLAALMWRRVFPDERERELTERVETLTKTRRGALDVQSAELRRIERDLHDGAQARLVALSMQLGRAEERLGDEPETAALLRAARSEASAAIAELRDLARGIAPPILADRGLPAAVEALARRSPVPVTIEAELEQRPPAVIETAAYFVVAEALTNVAKHAPDATATVRIGGGADVLRVEVTDDGPGGADPAGSGLEGLRARVAALDGELSLRSPKGAGATIEVELPCGS
jgi:signal transduction histidine kinase